MEPPDDGRTYALADRRPDHALRLEGGRRVTGELGHVDGDCSFERILACYRLDDPALRRIGEIVHEADIGDERFVAPEAAGIDLAVRALATSPIKKLVVPRVLATIVMMPVLTILADAVGLFGGYFIAVSQLGVSGDFFYNSLMQNTALGDLMSGLGKSIFFGYIIAIVACNKGLTATGGADGVGRATTSAVVQASISVLIADFFLTKLFLDL